MLRTFELRPTAWIERPRQPCNPLALVGVLDPEQPALAGIFDGRPDPAMYFALTRLAIPALNPVRRGQRSGKDGDVPNGDTRR